MRWNVCAAVACLVTVGSATAHADDRLAARLAGDGAFTPGLVRARGGDSFVRAATSWIGAADRVEVDAIGEAQLVGPVRLVLRVEDAFRDTARPGVGLGVQLLDEHRHGVAGTAYLQYKAEGFSEPEGELETTLALGRQLGAVRALVDVSYGQDPEGAERDGELALAVHVEPRRGLFTGVAARYRDALGTTRERLARDGFAGATATLAIHTLAVTAMTGVAMAETDRRRYGLSATLALGAVF